jgi:hypothetical protein
MRTAIESAVGSRKIDHGKAKPLEDHLDNIDQALDERDGEMAREEAKHLSMQVDDLKPKDADAATVQKLRTAADRLVAATNALPD